MRTLFTRVTRRSTALALVGLFFAVPQLRADLHGGIEIGAKGVKAAVVDVTGGTDGFNAKVLMSGTQNTTLTAGLATSGRFDADALKATAEAVAKFAGRMQNEFKVPSEAIHVVGSSGLFSALAGKADAIQANQDALAGAVRETCGLKMRFVSAKREVELSIVGAVPPRQLATAVLLDVGSGNTKGGYREGTGYVSAAVPFGSVTFADAVKKRGEPAATVRQEVLVPALKKALADKPELAKREQVYLSGGAIWAMATLVHPGDRGAYVALTAEDVEAYRQLLLKTPGQFPAVDLGAIADEAIRREAQKELDSVKETFTPDQLLAGAEIIKAMADEIGFGKDKKVYFTRNGYLAWVVAYAVEKGSAPK